MEFIEILKIIFIGLVEGITEWLPISSTGHMILVDEFIKLNVSPEFKEMFFVVIQLGAIIAVLVSFFNKLNPFSPKKAEKDKKNIWSLWAKIIIACLPAAIIGIPLDDKIDVIFYNYITVAITLIIYGIFFIILENKNKNKAPVINDFNDMSYKTAALIGIFQVLSLIPGTSRSGATILGAMLLGTSRYIAAEFSFYLAVPVMFGASALKLLKFGFDYSQNELVTLIIGMVVSFVVSIFAIRFLVSYIKKHDFKFFGWYRIILGLIVIMYFFFKANIT